MHLKGYSSWGYPFSLQNALYKILKFMDRSYLIFNSMIYWSIALVLMAFFAYFKFLNFALGVVMIFCAYIMQHIYTQGFSREILLIATSILIIYFGINTLALKYFKHTKQRELFWLIFTLWAERFIWNYNRLIFGPNAASINNVNISLITIVIIFITINIIVFYLIKSSFLGKIYKWIFENSKTIQSLGFKVSKNLMLLSIVLLLVLCLCGAMLLIKSNLRPSDGMFYIIKAIWIMILVWISKIERVFIWAFLYVLTEYLLFVKLWLPIAYKETLILIVILALLMFRPQGIFTLSSRRY